MKLTFLPILLSSSLCVAAPSVSTPRVSAPTDPGPASTNPTQTTETNHLPPRADTKSSVSEPPNEKRARMNQGTISKGSESAKPSKTASPKQSH
jgi:hypothetical protein